MWYHLLLVHGQWFEAKQYNFSPGMNKHEHIKSEYWCSSEHERTRTRFCLENVEYERTRTRDSHSLFFPLNTVFLML